MDPEHLNTKTSGSFVNEGRSLVMHNDNKRKGNDGHGGLVAIPVPLGASGEGSPYAPEDWPLPGDKWRWRVGRRISIAGYYTDRFLYPPPRYRCKLPRGRRGLTSRLLVEKFVLKEVPTVDLDSFFASFLWKIPSQKVKSYKDVERDYHCSNAKYSHDNAKLESELPLRAGKCKAGNTTCTSVLQARDESLVIMDCDICCSESGFCHDCCCILCGRTVDSSYGGYSFIKCEAKVDRDLICGHVAHMDCALRAYLAGTVRGSIGLDVEYYCRRCDNKTDLISHFTRLLHACKSLHSQDDIEKILNLGLCALRGSEKKRAKDLHAYIESVTGKLSNGVQLEEVWKMGDTTLAFMQGNQHIQSDTMMLGACNGESYQNSSDTTSEIESSPTKVSMDHKNSEPVYIISDHANASIKLEKDIDKVLQELKKSQESEYQLAEGKIYEQKNLLLNLYQQLDHERSELSCGINYDSLLTRVLQRVDQIKNEEAKLTQMMQVSLGFGQTPKDILKDHFGLHLNYKS